MKTKQLKQEYIEAYGIAMARLKEIENLIHDLPAPDSEDLHWGHFGDMMRIAESLNDIMPDEFN